MWHIRQVMGIGAIVARLLQGNQCLYDWIWNPFQRRESVFGIDQKPMGEKSYVLEKNLLLLFC